MWERIEMIDDLQRVCVKLYAPEPLGFSDQEFVPVLHEFIRDQALDAVFVDVADYTHVPQSPGIMLVSHAVGFSLDRSDGSFGLMAQRRRSTSGNAATAITATWRAALNLAAKLEADTRLAGKLTFGISRVRIEANDRLRAPNTEDAFRELEPFVRAAADAVYPARSVQVTRVANDARERLALELKISSAALK
jgi:hypothetical protein